MLNIASDPQTPIHQLVRRPTVIIPSESSLGEAARAMRDADVSCALLDDHRIITERDLTRGMAAGLAPADDAGAVAVANPVAVAAAMPVLEAAEVMLCRHIRHLVVTDRTGGVVGIVSLRDIVSVLILSTEPAMSAFLQRVVTEHSEIWLG